MSIIQNALTGNRIAQIARISMVVIARPAVVHTLWQKVTKYKHIVWAAEIVRDARIL